MTNHINPDHYQTKDGSQLIEHIENIPYNRGNAVKYLVRAGKKDSSKLLEDMEKALWYVQREIARLKTDVDR